LSEELGERNIDPTPLRREQFRKEGRFARSKDAGSVAATFAVLGVVVGTQGHVGRSVEQAFARCHGDLGALGRGDAASALGPAVTLFTSLALPAALGAAVTGAGVGLIQSGARVYTENLGFNAQRLNPFPNLARLFSPKQGSVQALLSILRVAFVGYVAYRALRLELPTLLTLSLQDVRVGAGLILNAAVRVALDALLALAAVAALEYAPSRM
jgi:flagellar biosynthesis protein FlhB